MKRAAIALVVVVAIAAAAVAIFGGNNGNINSNQPSTTNSNQNTTTPDNSNSSQTSTANKVSIANFAFTPAQLTVKKGTVVTWTNNDSITHTVTSDAEHGPKSDDLNPGKSYSFTFSDEGTFNYHCSMHPEMHGTVTVTE